MQSKSKKKSTDVLSQVDQTCFFFCLSGASKIVKRTFPKKYSKQLFSRIVPIRVQLSISIFVKGPFWRPLKIVKSAFLTYKKNMQIMVNMDTIEHLVA